MQVAIHLEDLLKKKTLTLSSSSQENNGESTYYNGTQMKNWNKATKLNTEFD